MTVMRVGSTHAAAHPGDTPRDVDPAATPQSDHRTVIGRVSALDIDGRRTVEVVVDGWRFDLVAEDARRADLRARATRDRTAAAGAGGPLEVRAIIPGRIAAVAVAAGDVVEADQTLLAVEAMKMQNELRAPRAGTVVRVLATSGATVEIGDLLVVLA